MNRICNFSNAAEMMWRMRRASSESARRRWERIVREQRSSGLSVAGFCRREGVPASSFFAWKRRLAEQGSQQGPAFVELVSAAPARVQGDQPLELLLGHDRRLLIRRGFDGQVLREVVRALEGLS
jgi:transposase-like protein